MKFPVYPTLFLLALGVAAHADENPFAGMDDPAAPATAAATENITGLSDEFGDAKTLTDWKLTATEEKWDENQIEKLDIGTTVKGTLALMPYTSGWYRDYRGVLLFKYVEGDFVATAHLRVTGRDGRSAPNRQFSLSGIMARAPRSITQETWQPGGENYVFVCQGATFQPNRYQFEIKTTRNSDSQVNTVDGATAEGWVQTVRVGPHFIQLGKPANGQWRVLRRFYRPELPSRLQVGITAYTDWNTIERLQPRDANTRRITEGQPDVLALYDWLRYARPKVPQELAGQALSDANTVSDQQLLQAFGDNVAGVQG